MSNSRSETGRHDLNEQEEVLFRSFITPERREQFLRRVGNPKTRARMLGQLYHFHDLDPRFAHRIAPRDQTVEKIHDLLRSKGAPALCHVVSTDRDLDGRDMDLWEALGKTVGQGEGTFVSCIPGRLAYFEGEEANERYLLERLPA